MTGRRNEAHVQRDDVALFEKRFLAGRGGIAIGACLLERRRPRPYHHFHPEGFSVARNDAADPAIATDAERLVAQRVADADLPFAGLERRHLLGNLAHGGKH